jgi:hypothetical protein
LSATAFALVNLSTWLSRRNLRVEELGGANRLVPDTVAIVARSLIGVAVRAGRPTPNIASIEAFVGTLRAASSIACAEKLDDNDMIALSAYLGSLDP